MKNNLTLFTLLLVGAMVNAQITALPVSLPGPGDTLISAVDPNYQPMVGTPGSSAQTWDFSGLQGFSYDTAYFRDTSTSAAAPNFPTAEVVFNFVFGEAFATRQNDQIEIIGFAGGADIIGINLSQNLSNPQVYRYTNFTYGAAYADTGEFRIQLDGSIIPPGTFPVSPDSVRLNYYGISADTCDAFGTLTTPTGTFDVVRMKRIQDSDVTAEAKFPLVGWQDVTALLPDLGFGRVVFYEYLSDSSKTAIAQVFVDNDGIPTRTQFRVDTTLPPPVTGILDFAETEELNLFPNPNNGSFQIDLSGQASELEIFTISGQQVYHEIISEGTRSKNLQLNLIPGTYAIRITENKSLKLYSSAFQVR
jgi:hypothetical protein